jgi:colanic acid/amylovoran biosynthesis protein
MRTIVDMKRNILLVNLHSALNLGDDAIMAATLAALNEKFSGAQICIAANHATSWRKYVDTDSVGSFATWMGDALHGRWRRGLALMPVYLALLMLVALIYRLSGKMWLFGKAEKRRLLRAYADADLVLSCGGGNYYAHRRFSPALWYALLAIAFPIGLGKRVIMLPQSVGPIDGKLQRWLAGQTFNRVAQILVRDPASHDFLIDRLSVRTPVLLFPDLAFLLSGPDSLLGEAKQAETVTQIGITAIDRGSQTDQFSQQVAYESALVAFAQRLQRNRDCHFHLFVQCAGPSQDQDDGHVSRRLAAAFSNAGLVASLIEGISDARALQRSYGQMDCMVATRMHTAILALGCSVPVVLIGYQPKSCSMMALFGLPDCCFPIDEIRSDRLYDLTIKLLDDPQARHTIAKKHAAIIEQLTHWTDGLTHD